MAVVISAVANKGTLWKPQFTEKIVSPDGRVLYRQRPEELGKVELRPETWDLLHQALYSVVKEGTGRRVRIPGLVIGGDLVDQAIELLQEFRRQNIHRMIGNINNKSRDAVLIKRIFYRFGHGASPISAR